MASIMESGFETLNEVFGDIDKAKEEKNKGEIERLLDEAQDTVDQLKMAIYSIHNKAQKKECNEKIRGYTERISQEKHSLLVGDGSSSKPKTKNQREEESLDRLNAARMQLQETEEVAQDTLVNLQKQRETIERSRKNNKEVNEELGKSRTLLNRMGKWWRG